MNNIYILTGPVKTGKTTKLMNWVKNRMGVSGILQPVINDKRHIYFIDTGETMPLELEVDSKRKAVEIGNYRFDEAAIEWAKGSMIFAFLLQPKIFLIDEFGKLELKGEGLEPVISQIVSDVKQNKEGKLILVIRDFLLEESVKYLNLHEKDFKIISSDHFNSDSIQL